MLDASAQPGSKPARPFTARDQFFVSCLWLAYNVQWGALLGIVIPDQILAIVGPARKEMYNGLVHPMGATVALFVTPIAGALSDRCRHPLGRRRPFLLAGVLLNILFLLVLGRFTQGSSILWFGLAYMGLQLGCNVWGGPYAGLIPDVVSEDRRGAASGWMGAMTAVGTIIGALSARSLVQQGNYQPIYLLIAFSILLMLGLPLWGVCERPRASIQA
jgi:MFS family permease